MTQPTLQLSSRRKRQLWRRIWYSYLVSLLARPGFLYGMLFGSSVQFLRELVFVRMVVANFLTVEVGQAPAYAARLLLEADLTKIIPLIVMTVSFLLLVRTIRRQTPALYRLPLSRLGIQ